MGGENSEWDGNFGKIFCENSLWKGIKISNVHGLSGRNSTLENLAKKIHKYRNVRVRIFSHIIWKNIFPFPNFSNTAYKL